MKHWLDETVVKPVEDAERRLDRLVSVLRQVEDEVFEGECELAELILERRRVAETAAINAGAEEAQRATLRRYDSAITSLARQIVERAGR